MPKWGMGPDRPGAPSRGPADFIREKPGEDVAGQGENRIFNRESVIRLKLQ